MACILSEKQKYNSNLRDVINDTVDFEGYEEGRSEWEQWITDNFYDAELIIKAIDENGGELPFSFSLNNKEAAVEKSNSIIVQEGTNIDAEREYLKRKSFGAYRRLKNNFKKAIITNTLFSISESPDGTWTTSSIKKDVTSSKYPGVNILNQNIFDYKMSLVNDISKFTGTNFNTQYISPEQMTRLILTAIQDFEGHDTQDLNNPKYRKALDAFVILKTFDNLIESEIDFLESTTPKGIHKIDQYKYIGPKSVHLNNYSDESADIHKTTSKLQKTILTYLPIISVDKHGRQYLDWNYSVEGEGGGFDQVVARFKEWVMLTLLWQDPIKQGILSKNINNLDEAFQQFIDSYGKYGNKTQSKIILDKARSIKEFIWSPKSKLSREIKDMFKQQLFKTVEQSYVSYRVKNGQAESYKLREQFINIQSLALQDNVKSMQATYRINPTRYEALKNRWGIEVEGNEIIIGRTKNIGLVSPLTIKYSTAKNQVEGVSSRLTIRTLRDKDLSEFSEAERKNDNAVAARLISDILQTTIPSNYDEILEQLSRGSNDLTLLEQFAEPIGLLFAAVEDIGGINSKSFNDKDRLEFKVNSYINVFTDSATFLSLAYGTDIVSTLRNQAKNNIPSSGLTSMGAQTPSLIKSLEDRHSTVNEANPIVNSIVSIGNIGIKPTTIRTDSSYKTDIVKASKALSSSELGFIEIMDDFLGNLWKVPESKSSTEKHESGTANYSDILLQFTTTSDKSTHPLLPIDLSKMLIGDKRALDIFRDICSRDGINKNAIVDAKKAETAIQNAIIKYRQARINDQITKLINQYTAVFPELNLDNDNLTVADKLIKIDNFIRTWNNTTFYENRDKFVKAGYDFINEIHYSKISDNSKFAKGKWGLNETMLHYFDVYNDSTKSKSRFARQLFRTALEISKNDIQLTSELHEYALSKLGGEKFNNKWVGIYSKNINPYIIKDSEGKTINIEFADINDIESYRFNEDGLIELIDSTGEIQYKVEINPIVKSYFYADAYYGNAYKDLTLGDAFNHATKYTATNDDYYSDGTRKESYYIYNEASREGNGFKRAVIVGATHHPFAMGLKYGVSRYLNVAVIQDLKGNVWNLAGLSNDNLDSMDGSGFVSPYQSIIENWSLLDAAVGDDKKTIFGDIDPIFGGQRLLKWAVYSITNSRRRMSWGSDIRLQDIFTRMHNKPIVMNNINLSKYYSLDGRVFVDEYKQITRNKPLFFKDADGNIFKEGESNSTPGRHFQILSISNTGQEAERVLQEVDINSKVIGEPFSEKKLVNNIASLDEFFGGAWAEELDNNGELQYTESNNELVANIICNDNLHDSITGYLVNESAMKVGVSNINSSEKWYSGELDTFKMSIEFGGVQMDAGHELDLSQVTEMSQMISALSQGGYMNSLVNEIYADIGKVAAEGISDIKEGLISGDKDKIYRIIGKALIESINTEDTDTIGLTKSFVTKASEYLTKEKIDYKIPFSSGSINSKFIATVISMINKSGIRRKYSGIAAVLVPSHNIIQYYRLGDKTYTYDEFADLLNSNPTLRKGEFGEDRPWTVEEYLTDIGYDKNNNPTNPYIKSIAPQDVDIEDTILYRKAGTQDKFTVVKVDSYRKYDFLRNVLRNTGQYEFYNWTVKPKNLRQANTLFDVELGDGRIYRMSMYDFDSVRSNHYLSDFKGEFSLSMVEDLNQRLTIKNALDHLHLIDPKFEYEGDDTVFNVKELKKLLSKLTQYELRLLRDNKPIYWNTCLPLGDTFKYSNVQFRAAEMILGRLHAKELGLGKKDTIASVREQNANFFRNKLNQFFAFPSEDTVKSQSYDLMLIGEDGKKTLVVIGDQKDVVNKFDYLTLTSNSDYYTVGNKVLYNSDEFCNSGDVTFNKAIAADGTAYDVIAIKSIDKLDDILNTSGLFTDVEYNYKESNWKELFRYQHKDIIDSDYTIKDGKSIRIERYNPKTNKKDITEVYDNFNNFIPLKDWVDLRSKLNQEREVLLSDGLSENEVNQIIEQEKEGMIAKYAISILKEYHEADLSNKIDTKARLQYEAFEKQLDYIGARIPTQSMQSFMALRLVGFSDSETNDVYVPKSQTWLQGSK